MKCEMKETERSVRERWFVGERGENMKEREYKRERRERWFVRERDS